MGADENNGTWDRLWFGLGEFSEHEIEAKLNDKLNLFYVQVPVCRLTLLTE